MVKIKRVWILGAISFEMEEIAGMLRKANERFFSCCVTGENYKWRFARSKREAFSKDAYGVIFDLYPEYAYFIECATRIFYPTLITHEKTWPIYVSITGPDIVSDVRLELKRIKG